MIYPINVPLISHFFELAIVSINKSCIQLVPQFSCLVSFPIEFQLLVFLSLNCCILGFLTHSSVPVIHSMASNLLSISPQSMQASVHSEPIQRGHSMPRAVGTCHTRESKMAAAIGHASMRSHSLLM
jgi:hypothetical protein